MLSRKYMIVYGGSNLQCLQFESLNKKGMETIQQAITTFSKKELYPTHFVLIK